MASLQLVFCMLMASSATLGSANNTNATTTVATANVTTTASATTAAATTAAATTAAATTAAATTAAATTASATTAAATTAAATTAAATTAVATTAGATTTIAATTVASSTTVAATTIASNETTEAATATVFAGRFGLTMSSAHATAMISAFETDTSVRTALQNGIATGLSIDSSMVEVTGVSRQAARRLTAGSSVVQVDYRITVPSGSSTTLTISNITDAQTALKEGINGAMTAQSLSYVVTDLSAPEPTRTTVTLTTTTAIAEAAASNALKAPASCVSIIAGLSAVVLLAH
jgi:hypothetical protein